MALVLRPYQENITSQARELMKKGVRKMLIVSPTGSGKTALTANMLGTSARKGLRSQFIVHRRELVKQSAMAFYKADVPHGIVANQFPQDPRQPVQICSVGTLARRFHKIHTPQLVIWDECHHIAANSWEKIFKAYPKAFHIGLTATPERLDGKGLRKYFDQMIEGPTVEWLIENKYLAPYRLYAPGSVSLEGVRKQMGDFRKSDLISVVDKPRITGDAIREYKKVADGKRAVVFCVSVKHSQHVVKSFNDAGVSAVHVDGDSHSSVRDAAIERFAKGEIKVLSNVDLFGEGFDLPSIEACIMLRPTQSLGLYLQQVGRALRPSPGKDEAIILDHVGNYERHGLPDEKREWSLDGRIGRNSGKKTDGPSLKVCDNCFAAQPPHADKCKYCNFEFQKQPRSVEEVEGELVEVDPKVVQMKRKKEQKQAKTFEQLVEIGKQRGYKKPYGWAKHVFNARQARRNKGL